MRSSAVIASALAMGVVLAHPHGAKLHHHLKKRLLVTETELIIETITVYVTAVENAEVVSTSSCSPTTSIPTPEPTPTKVYTSMPLPPTSILTSSLVSTPSSTPTPETKTSSEPVQTPTSTSTLEPEPEPSSTYVPPSSSTTPAPEPTASGHLSGTDQAYLSAGPDYQAAMLYHHNAARANHDAEPLVWDSDCEAAALLAAQTCTFEHYIPEGVAQGQNLFTVSGDAFNATAGVTESWYKGELKAMEPYWGQSDIPDDVFHNVGHLTQMVWKGTTKVGCVSIDCGNSMIVSGSTSTMNKYTVCNYSPPGNMGGAYAENVVPPISMTNLGSWAD